MISEFDIECMDLAFNISEYSACHRRKIGAVITNHKNRTIAVGYNRAPNGIKNCIEKGFCIREKLNIPSGTQHEKCMAVHAEQMVICEVAKNSFISLRWCTLYTTTYPCSICAKLIAECDIKRVVYKEGYPDDLTKDILKNITVERIE